MTTVSKPALPGFEERRIRHRATSIRYLVAGSGPPLALVHGLGGFAGNWRAIAPALALERRVIVPELPGHGGSEPLHAAPTLDPFAEAMLAVLAAEDALPAPWVGHSLGGLVAVRLALRRPDAVSALVLAGSAGLSTGRRLVRLLDFRGWRSPQGRRRRTFRSTTPASSVANIGASGRGGRPGCGAPASGARRTFASG